MILCDFCNKWCHDVCENIPPNHGDTVDTYKCVACSGFDSDSVFPSTTGLSQAFSMCTLDDATESELIVESSLADFEHANNSATVWGNVPVENMIAEISQAYEQIVYWPKNLFKLPSGSPGKKYVTQMTILLKEWKMKGQFESTAPKTE